MLHPVQHLPDIRRKSCKFGIDDEHVRVADPYPEVGEDNPSPVVSIDECKREGHELGVLGLVEQRKGGRARLAVYTRTIHGRRGC